MVERKIVAGKLSAFIFAVKNGRYGLFFVLYLIWLWYN